MSLTMRIIVSGVIIAVMVGVICVDPAVRQAGPEWLWRGGRGDLVRNMLFRADGTLRRYIKLGMILWLVLGLVITWMIPVRS